MNEKKLKPIHSLLAVFLSGTLLFGIAPFLFRGHSTMRIFGGEILILLVAVLIPAFSKVSLGEVFTFQRIHLKTLFGCLIMWAALMVLSLTGMMWFLHFYPEQAGAVDEINRLGNSMPLGMAILGIAVMPALCEEGLFRGTILAGLRNCMPDVLVILMVGMVFGAFHGNALRFIPTAMLGMLFSYIVLKTDNMFYSIMLHFINNMIPVLIMQKGLSGVGSAEVALDGVSDMVLPVYTFWAAFALIVMTIGKIMLDQGEGFYEGKIFERRTRPAFIKAFLGGAALLVLAIWALKGM